MNIIWRIAGFALMAGLVLFLVSLIIKVLLVGLVTFGLVRFVGPRLAGRAFGPLGRGGWSQSDVIAIDSPTFRSGIGHQRYERIIAIN